MATIYQRNGRWQIQWREDRKLYRRSLGKIDKSSAEKILHAKEFEIRTGRLVYDTDGDSFLLVANEYLSWHKFEYPDSHDRINQITEQHLIPFFGLYPAGKIEPHAAEDYKRIRSQIAKPETVNKELRTLHAILNKSVEWGRLQRNPIKSVKSIKNKHSKPKRWYSIEELSLIYEIDPEHKSIWKLLVNTGLRRGEALSLKWPQVFDNHIDVISTDSNRTKSGRWRRIPLSPGAIEALSELRKNKSKTVIPKIAGPSLTRAFSKTIDRAGLDGSLHCLRHTFCSHLVMRGVPLRTVQILAGHSSIRTTEIYAHLSPDYLADSVSKIDL